jgi:DNA-binding LacI/PurR family transcriptional regulator
VDAFVAASECDTVLTDNLRGAYEAVKYLIEQGHSRIGLVGSTTTRHEHPSISERRQGYLKALTEYGIRETLIEDSLLQSESAYQATLRLLDDPRGVTAIFACNDDVAMNVIRAVKDRGRRVPEDVSVIGFDDQEGSANTQPPLTTMQIDKELMGGLAVRQLYERAMKLDRPPITTLISTRLVVRDSVTRCAVRQEQALPEM